jgi:hypothetical protein
LALACLPFPFLFYRYGPAIRRRCRFAAEAARVMENIRQAELEYNSSDNREENLAEKKDEDARADV